MAMQHAANPVVGVNRHGAFFHDYLVTTDGAGNLRDDGLHVRQVGGAGVALRSADSDEDSLALFDGAAQVAGEFHTAVKMLGQQLGQQVLEDGHAAFPESLDPGFVVVHADHVVAHFRKANRGNQAHVP